MTNAADLLAEADMLFDGKRYARAVALAHFAMEEMGKVVSLISQAVELAIGNEPDWVAAEKAWSSHDLKFELFHVIDLVTQASSAKASSANLEVLHEFELRLAGRPLREMSLYVDIEDRLAKVPSERFDDQLAKLYLGTAFHTGKFLIDILPSAGERLETLAQQLADPEPERRSIALGRSSPLRLPLPDPKLEGNSFKRLVRGTLRRRPEPPEKLPLRGSYR